MAVVRRALCRVSLLLLAVGDVSQSVGDVVNNKIRQQPSLYVLGGTNGTLTLTCDVLGLSAGVVFLWSDQNAGLLPCMENNISWPTCTYQPQLQTADKIVTCRAVLPDRAPVLLDIVPDIMYPPQSDPAVVMETPHDGPLRQGDVVTCSVTGGKPLVTAVYFHCIDPKVPDQDDVTGVGRVSSSITVDTLNATEKNMTCSCNANWGPQSSLYNNTVSQSYQVQYPPRSSPMLAAQEQPLGVNPQLNCSVAGGSPPVSNVSVDCRGVKTTGRRLEQEGDVVTSVITLDPSEYTEEGVTCDCSAVWDPKPAYYDIRTSAYFILLYKAHVTSFTLNGTGRLTVRDTDHANVRLQCSAAGRPASNVTVYRGAGGGVDVVGTAQAPETNRTVIAETDWVGDLVAASVNLTANYTCVGANGYQLPDLATVELLVSCEPVAEDGTFTNHIPELSETSSVDFILQAVPVPQLRILHSVSAAISPSSVDAMFTAGCSRIPDTPYLVNCTIRVINTVTEALAGRYNGTATNERGAFRFQFDLPSSLASITTTGSSAAVGTPGAAAGSPAGAGTLGAGPIVGIVLGALLFAALLFVLAAFIIRRHCGSHEARKSSAGSGVSESHGSTASGLQTQTHPSNSNS